MAEQQTPAQETTAPQASVEDRIAAHFLGTNAPPAAESPAEQQDEPPPQEATDADPDDLSDVADQLPDEDEPAPTSDLAELELTYNGQPLRVSVDEAKNLAQLGKLYTDKQEQSDKAFQHAADMLAQAQAVAQQMTPQLLQAQGTIALYDQALGSFNIAEMRQLARDDPAAYLEKQAERDALAQQRQAAVQHYQQLANEVQTKTNETRQGLLSQEAALAQKLLPRLKSQQTETQKAIVDYLQSTKTRRHTAEAINSNAELLAMAFKASQYDRLQATKHQKVADAAKAPQTMRPGAAQPANSAQISREQKLRARLKNTGSVDDFASLLLAKGFK